MLELINDRQRASLSLSLSFFFLCGISAALNVILIPFLQNAFKLSYTSASLIQVSFYSAYFIFSPLTGHFFQRRPLLSGIHSALVLTTVGSAIIAFAYSYELIILGIFVLGAGIAMIQVTGSPYAMLAGSKQTAASRLTLAQAFTSAGAVISPYLGSYFLLSEMGSIPLLYIFLSLFWGGVLFFSLKAALPQGERETFEYNDSTPDKIVWLGMTGIGLACGIEVTVSTYLIQYLVETTDMSIASAGKWMMIFWLGLFIGRLLGSKMLKKWSAEKMLFYHSIAGIILVLYTLFYSPFAILFIGFAISIKFPVIFSLVIERSRFHSSKVAGVLCMANIGGALLPYIQGYIADTFGLHLSFILPLLGFIYLAFFAQTIKSIHSYER